ncbi:isochorismatase family protein [Undibacterium sp. TS12]|uniref:isochorismatase family protein n=1 Tax=Undibacterium sp. TS12 TaxID=2908202 RepID=UPI001F4CD3C3|nr:isochorismatase family protein [Undibacterium sp. TS12]MCH8621524.1 isochorismatase family protein [Undibacterium sp. TS12]
MQGINLDATRTALVLIDLQNSNMARTLAPYSSAKVLDNCQHLVKAMKACGALVIYVRVDVNKLLHLPVDISLARDPNAGPAPESVSQLTAAIDVQADDILVTKFQWGAFYGTALEQHLRRHGIRSIILAGIATNFGVESTARAAFDSGYELIFAEDAMSSISAELHEFAVGRLFPFMGRVRKTTEILYALGV